MVSQQFRVDQVAEPEARMTALEEFKASQERLLERFGLDAESRFLEVPTVAGRVHVLVQGEGPPVVLVPGFADPAAMWAPLMAELSGFRLYAVDRPCFGLSGRAEHQTGSFRTLAVQFLDQVLEGLELERALFVGNSIGSLWSLWLALDRPGRVSAMAHMGCPAFILGTSAPLLLRLLSVPVLGRLMARMAPPSRQQVESFAHFVGADLSDAPELADLLVAAQRLPGAQREIRRLLHAVIRLRGPRPALVLTEEDLTRIRQHVLLVWGGRDPFGAVEVGEEVASLIDEADFHVIPEGGHVPWVGHAGEVAAVTKPFLRAVA